jgi:hypothetical protein
MVYDEHDQKRDQQHQSQKVLQKKISNHTTSSFYVGLYPYYITKKRICH